MDLPHADVIGIFLCKHLESAYHHIEHPDDLSVFAVIYASEIAVSLRS